MFDEINATMAELTGVSPTQPDVLATYEQVKQQLPTVENIDAFVSSHQVAIAQLAIEYCDALVEDTGARAAFFPGFDFAAQPVRGLQPRRDGRSCSTRWSPGCWRRTSRPSPARPRCAPSSTT